MGTGSFFCSLKNEPVPIILGPTASGKTEIALKLAKRLNTEIISADPMLVYKGFDIGTAKPSPEDLKSIKHHLVDILEPDEVFSAADFASQARKIIKDLLDRGKIPIVVGGTGLYIRILINGIFEAPKPDWDLRKKLEEEAKLKGSGFLYEKLLNIDPETAKKLHKNDLRRIIRAIEIYELTGKQISLWKKLKNTTDEFDFIMVGLKRDRAALYDRVNNRVDDMIKNGFVSEVETLLSKHKKNAPAFKGLGYKELAEFLTNSQQITKYNLVDVIDKIKINTRRYVKRQITWFKKEPGIIWINLEEKDISEDIVEKIIKLLKPDTLLSRKE